MQIKCNDPLNLFTHQVEQYPPVQDIIQGIRTANHNITNNLKSLENFIESEKSKELKKIQFLTEQMTYNHAHAPILIKKLYFYA